jgi:hypothetical protein
LATFIGFAGITLNNFSSQSLRHSLSWCRSANYDPLLILEAHKVRRFQGCPELILRFRATCSARQAGQHESGNLGDRGPVPKIAHSRQVAVGAPDSLTITRANRAHVAIGDLD